MRPDLITRGSPAGGTALAAKLSKGHVNGLIIVQAASDATAQVNVRRRTKGQTYILASMLPIGDLARIAELDGGFGFGASRFAATLLQTLVTKTTINDAERHSLFELVTGQRGLNFSYVDLGSLFLSSDNELDVSVTPTAGAAANLTAIYSVSNVKKPDFMRAYDVVLDGDTTHHDVESIFYRSSSEALFDVAEVGGAVTESAVGFQIRDDDDVAVIDGLGALAASLITCGEGGMSDQTVVRLYRKRDALPADVYLKVTGVALAAADKYLIVSRLLYDAAVTSANTVAEATSFAQRTARLEADDPETARALRHSGLIVAASDLAARVQAVS